MTCDECRILLTKYLDGPLPPADRDILHAHVEQCPLCREEYDRITATQTLLRTAFGSRKSASDATASILSELADRPVPSSRESAPAFSRGWLRNLSMAAAIAIALAAGAFLGSGWSRRAATDRLEASRGAVVPIRVAGTKGTVLVKRVSSEVWTEMTPASLLHVGDVFQASPKSEMTLSFQDGSTLALSANSRLALEHYNGGVRLNLSAGRMKASLNSPHPPFIVSTPGGQLEALGTEFTVSVE